ncbi:Gfo/Idh/MocA family protein [Martelella mediterranea]|uniref:Putative dehydrogenase n=1 Tax=Martelella mediterranea TaxID=293089 RepID=A0A4R3NIW0_9HYPH|nr:Gfo/Idh/MocA family oxidoreductase [Martelella mediterranea]TCT33009.1 putative dehydrogenase [Martelella mediterranea]
MKTVLGVGLIGCGNISSAYLARAKSFANIAFAGVADMNMAAAEERGAEFGLPAMTPEALLAHPDVDIVLNLTPPAAHFAVSKMALEAGKHVYCEKPFVLDVAEGKELIALAETGGLRIGSAPDTTLGASHQLARHMIDDGAVGAVTSGTCFVMNHGMEEWHPSPDFFFRKGGGPILDLGPYYVANLVQLLGPVTRVVAEASKPEASRIIGTGPRAGEIVPVEVATTVQAILTFDSGALVTLVASWDVWQHDLAPMALYGSEGTVHVPDPNFFDGPVVVTKRRETFELPQWNHPLGPPNRTVSRGKVADYRTSGLADMAQAIVERRHHRCNGEFALHVVDVLTAILRSSEEKSGIAVSTRCLRPEALGADQATRLLKT